MINTITNARVLKIVMVVLLELELSGKHKVWE